MDQFMDIVWRFLPAIVTGFVLFVIQRAFKKRDKEDASREKRRVRNNALILKGILASIALSEAAAIAIERGKCNGEMKNAKTYARDIKHDIRDFMTETCSEYVVGCEHIMNGE